jgi:hypothetical protein
MNLPLFKEGNGTFPHKRGKRAGSLGLGYQHHLSSDWKVVARVRNKNDKHRLSVREPPR